MNREKPVAQAGGSRWPWLFFASRKAKITSSGLQHQGLESEARA